MKYRSTRGASPVGLDEALVSGIAADGGLFLPVELPHFDMTAFSDAATLQDTATIYLQPFFEGSSLGGQLAAIVDETFRFPIPVNELPVAD